MRGHFTLKKFNMMFKFYFISWNDDMAAFLTYNERIFRLSIWKFWFFDITRIRINLEFTIRKAKSTFFVVNSMTDEERHQL